MGYVYALIAALLFGANGSVTRVTIEAGLSPAQLTLFRVLGAAALCGIAILITDRRAFAVRPRQLLALAAIGMTGVALLQWTYAAAIERLPVGITLLIEYTAVLMVAVIAFFFFKEPVRARLWVAIGCMLVGLAIAARIWVGDLDPVGVAFAFGAAVSLTVYFLGGERAVGQIPPLAVAFWTLTFASAFWLLFSGWWSIDPALFSTSVSLSGNLESLAVPAWGPLAWNVVLGTFAPFLFSLLALQRLSATAVGIVASSEVIFAFAVAWVWLGESLGAVQILGAAIVLVGIVLAQTARAGKVVDPDLALAPAGAPPSG